MQELLSVVVSGTEIWEMICQDGPSLQKKNGFSMGTVELKENCVLGGPIFNSWYCKFSEGTALFGLGPSVKSWSRKFSTVPRGLYHFSYGRRFQNLNGFFWKFGGLVLGWIWVTLILNKIWFVKIQKGPNVNIFSKFWTSSNYLTIYWYSIHNFSTLDLFESHCYIVKWFKIIFYVIKLSKNNLLHSKTI